MIDSLKSKKDGDDGIWGAVKGCEAGYGAILSGLWGVLAAGKMELLAG
jgi:hypothetical protein